jgi:trigger factor
MKNNVIEAVYNANEIDIPAVMVDDEITSMLNEFDQQLRMQGMDLETYFQYMGANKEDFREELREEAYRKVKTRMIVSAIADEEEIQASEEDIENELEVMAIQYKMDKDQIREMLGVENMIFVANDIRMKKAVEMMYEAAVIK